MTPHNVGRSRQDIALWLAIGGILATAIGFS